MPSKWPPKIEGYKLHESELWVQLAYKAFNKGKYKKCIQILQYIDSLNLDLNKSEPDINAMYLVVVINILNGKHEELTGIVEVLDAYGRQQSPKAVFSNILHCKAAILFCVTLSAKDKILFDLVYRLMKQHKKGYKWL